MGCAARSRQGAVERVSEQRAHWIGSAAAVAPVAPLVRVLSSAISSTMCAASENTAAVTDAGEVVGEVVRRMEAASSPARKC